MKCLHSSISSVFGVKTNPLTSLMVGQAAASTDPPRCQSTVCS